MDARSIILVIALLSVSVIVCYAQENQLPKEVEAVRRYILEKDYPELFGGTNYRTKIENAIIAANTPHTPPRGLTRRRF
jgi:hypothetical protein